MNITFAPTIAYFFGIFEYLELEGYSTVSVISNIILKRFIYEHVSEETNIYAISSAVFDYYHKEILSPNETKELVVEEDTALYTTEASLEHIFVDDNKINEILNVLERKKNIILQGVPGVGKTFIIKNLLESRYNISKDNYQVVQFHQSYSYEEFIEGLRPVEGVFEVKEGIFKEFSEKAKRDPSREYFFVIDEINRGNLSKIFGELLMLIEADKRVNYAAKLPYSGKDLSLPENLYIIGTMNTADRSLSLVDYALRRRFSFITLEPAFNTTKFNKYMVQELNYSKEELAQINDTMLSINRTIKNNLSENFEIGHSYFVIKDRSDNFEEFINEIYKYEILPLVQEYFFDSTHLVKQIKDEMKIYE